jgi:tetratricopeptide (TPR) repeat protein
MVLESYALLFDDLMEYQAALDIWDRIIIDGHPGGHHWESRGYIKIKLGMYHEAISDFEMALSVAPFPLSSALNGKGLAMYLKGEYDEAINTFEAYLENNVDTSASRITESYVYSNKGNCHFALDNLDQACSCWKKAIELGYIYDPKWKVEFQLESPWELIESHCH